MFSFFTCKKHNLSEDAGSNNQAKIYIKSKRIEISPLNDVYFQIHISVSYKMSNLIYIYIYISATDYSNLTSISEPGCSYQVCCSYNKTSCN